VKPDRHQKLQDALAKLALETRKHVPIVELQEAEYEEWADSLVEHILDDADVMNALAAELFELVTGKEIADE
jgi:hypothetical protein